MDIDIDDVSSKETRYILVEIPDYNPGTPGYLRYLLLGNFAPSLLFLKIIEEPTVSLQLAHIIHDHALCAALASLYSHTECYITHRGRLLEEVRHIYTKFWLKKLRYRQE